jgi:hypothetical protein
MIYICVCVCINCIHYAMKNMYCVVCAALPKRNQVTIAFRDSGCCDAAHPSQWRLTKWIQITNQIGSIVTTCDNCRQMRNTVIICNYFRYFTGFLWVDMVDRINSWSRNTSKFQNFACWVLATSLASSAAIAGPDEQQHAAAQEATCRWGLGLKSDVFHEQMSTKPEIQRHKSLQILLDRRPTSSWLGCWRQAAQHLQMLGAFGVTSPVMAMLLIAAVACGLL